MKRTGSRYSRVPPAETTTRRPARSWVVAPPWSSRRARMSAARAKISAGSGSRPLPVSAPVSRPSAGSMTTAPRDAQRGHVGLGGGVLPHLGVHRGREHDRAARGEQGVGEQVVGQAVGRLGEQVGGRRGHHDELGLLADPDVRHLVDVGPHLGAHRLAGQRGPGRGADELQGGGGRDDGDVVAGLGEPAQQLTGLVRSNPAAHAEDDARAGLGWVAISDRPAGSLDRRLGRRASAAAGRPRRPAPRRRPPRGRCPRRSAGRR